MRHLKYIIILILLFTSPVWATNYWIDEELANDCTSSDYDSVDRDCSGSEGHAYNTGAELQTIFDSYDLAPGDNIYVRGAGDTTDGIYIVADIEWGANDIGSAGNRVTLSAYNSEDVYFVSSTPGLFDGEDEWSASGIANIWKATASTSARLMMILKDTDGNYYNGQQMPGLYGFCYDAASSEPFSVGDDVCQSQTDNVCDNGPYTIAYINFYGQTFPEHGTNEGCIGFSEDIGTEWTGDGQSICEDGVSCASPLATTDWSDEMGYGLLLDANYEWSHDENTGEVYLFWDGNDPDTDFDFIAAGIQSNAIEFGDPTPTTPPEGYIRITGITFMVYDDALSIRNYGDAVIVKDILIDNNKFYSVESALIMNSNTADVSNAIGTESRPIRFENNEVYYTHRNVVSTQWTIRGLTIADNYIYQAATGETGIGYPNDSAFVLGSQSAYITASMTQCSEDDATCTGAGISDCAAPMGDECEKYFYSADQGSGPTIISNVSDGPDADGYMWYDDETAGGSQIDTIAELDDVAANADSSKRSFYYDYGAADRLWVYDSDKALDSNNVIYDSAYQENIRVERNTIVDTSQSGYVNKGSEMHCIQGDGHSMIIKHNICQNPKGDGIALLGSSSLWVDGVKQPPTKIENNRFIDCNGSGGVAFWHHGSDFEVTNNTFVNTVGEAAIYIKRSDSYFKDITIKNNIFSGGADGIEFYADNNEVSHDYNLCYGQSDDCCEKADGSACSAETNGVTGQDPLLTSAPGYQIGTGSPAYEEGDATVNVENHCLLADIGWWDPDCGIQTGSGSFSVGTGYFRSKMP